MEATGKKTTVTDLLSLSPVRNIDETSLHQRFIDRRWQDYHSTMSTLRCAAGMDNGLMTPVVYNAEKWACQSWL